MNQLLINAIKVTFDLDAFEKSGGMALSYLKTEKVEVSKTLPVIRSELNCLSVKTHKQSGIGIMFDDNGLTRKTYALEVSIKGEQIGIIYGPVLIVTPTADGGFTSTELDVLDIEINDIYKNPYLEV